MVGQIDWGHITNDGVWWLLAAIIGVLVIVFILTPLLERTIEERLTGHEDED